MIAVAGHDTGSAVAAVPAVSKNFAYLSSGTWSLMGVETEEPVITAETERLNFTNEGGVQHTIRLLKNICGMWLLERCRPNWGETDYGQLIAGAEASEPFKCLIDPDDQMFANPADMETAIKDYCKKTSQPVPANRDEIVRCIFDSLALRYREVLEMLRTLSTANAIGLPVVAGPSEATAIGNIMVQAMASGEASDLYAMRKVLASTLQLDKFEPQNAAAWDAAYAKFKKIVNR